MAISSSRSRMPRQATLNSLMIGFSSDSDLSHFILPRNGIQFPRQLSYEKWSSIGRQLSALGSSSAWCLGDWIVHGEIAYAGRYRDAVEKTSLDYQTLRNYAWVARRFELSRRRDTLSFGHHAEVASLPAPEQDFWLRKAQELSWSRNQLRREVRASLADRAMAGEQLPARSVDGRNEAADLADDSPVSREVDADDYQIQLKLSPEQLEHCRVAARRTGCSIQEWAVLVLDRVARDGLILESKRRRSG